MFVRKKVTRSGTTKHYLVESHREGGKVRQKVLYYLGTFPTVEAELALWASDIQHNKDQAAYWREEADAAKGQGLDPELTERCVTLYESRAAEHDAAAARCEARRDNLLSILQGHGCSAQNGTAGA